LTQPIIVNQHSSKNVWRFTLAFTLGDALTSQLNEGERVSATGLKQDHVEVHIAAAILEQATDKYPIAALALSLATQEDAATLRSEQALTTHHPI
jgi:hypothetical protein